MNRIYLLLGLFLTINYCDGRRKTPTVLRPGCRFRLPIDIPENEPVYLMEDDAGAYTIYQPNARDNLIGPNRKLTLFCPGNRNTLSLSNRIISGNSNITDATCKSNGKFDVNGNDYEFYQLNCTRETVGDIRMTRTSCAGGRGNVNEIGFKLSPHTFIPLIEICYNNRTASVIYTSHLINGRAIKFNVQEKERRDFKSIGVPSPSKPQNSYKKAKQQDHFNTILGAQQNFFTDTSFLSRGHMTPDADFIFTTGQFATYFYVNVAPQFQDINGGNWLKVENMARTLAAKYNSTFAVYTGSYEQLELPNSNGELVPLWMERNDKIEVPKWLWKVMINSENDAGIVMITLNNPFLRRSDVHEFCTNVCERAGLSSNNFSRMNKGYTFCCEVNDFRRIVDVLPSHVTAENLIGCSGVSFNSGESQN